MEQSELQVHMNELAQKIAMLPPGSIVKKTVTGREYYYHRWTENKKRHEKYIPAEVLDSFRAQIEQRKELEQELKALKKMLPRQHRLTLLLLPQMSALVPLCAHSLLLSNDTKNESAFNSCIIFYTVKHRTKFYSLWFAQNRKNNYDSASPRRNE